MIDLLMAKYPTLSVKQINFLHEKIKQVDKSGFDKEAQDIIKGGIWDKKSAINGVPADKVMEAHRNPTEAFYIINDGSIQIFQPFYGEIASADLKSKLNAMLGEMRQGYISHKLLELSEQFFSELPDDTDISVKLDELLSKLK